MSYYRVIGALLLRTLNKKRLLVKLFYCTVVVGCFFILLIDPRLFNSTQSPSLAKSIATSKEENYTAPYTVSHSTKQSLTTGYTSYTIRRLGIKPLSHAPLHSSIREPVINDVLAFQYPIDIDPREKLKCHRWADRSSTSNSVTNSTLNVNRTLLIIVISGTGHWAKRDLIRKTWARPNRLEVDWIQVIFLIGSTQKEDKELEEKLRIEKEEHGDLVQVNVVDTYENLTLKSVALLHWTYSRCPHADMILKCDDDIYLNMHELKDLLNQQEFQSTNRLYGLGVVKDQPQRNPSNKYYISRLVWPWPKYPSFLSGGGYLLGRETIQPLLAASQTTPYFPLEDIYITGLCARKARISSISSQRIYERFIPKKLDACFVRTTSMWQTQSRFQFLHSHDVVSLIYRRRLPCRAACKYLGIC